MLEVRSGVLLGSMGDALATITRVASITKVYSITHVLTVANQTLDWSLVGGEDDQQPAKENGDKETEKLGERKDCENGARDERKEEEGKEVTDVEVEVGGARKEACRGFKTMYICLPDMPSSDLLHHFDECCQFIREAVDQGGTVLVHCEHGVSRSVTVVLAYLMWSEGRSFQVLYDQLKKMKPEIRPNNGFIEQLKLWGAMRCKIDLSNKSYRAYRLQHMAKDMIDSGYVENLHSSLDPSTNVLESSAYFRCRKCRRLLFTEESVLQHELGRGQLAFKWNKRAKKTSPSSTSSSSTKMPQSPKKQQPSSEDNKEEGTETSRDVASVQDSVGEEKEEEDILASSSKEKTPASPHEEGGRLCGEGERDSVPEQTPVPVTPTELAELRAHLASVVAMGNSSYVKCSSYFIEPVEWMEATLLGQVEGKIICPKCKGRLGSFNWSGDQCSCGQWVVPSFQIHRSKVDETRTLTKRKPRV